MTGAVSAIDCPNCGAGISVLGGGRVTTQVCSYCGARLDATDAYRVLSVHANMKRPASPFSLGMTGMIDGVEHTIIGTIGYIERYAGEAWRWVDHMLYSPTHGYAWLTLEDGHTLLTRKVRDWPGGSFVTPAAVERAEARPTRLWRGKTYTYYDQSSWEIEFVEGGFTWRPEKGQRGHSVSMMPSGVASDMLTYAGGEEREIEVTRYFPEAAELFGAEPPVPEGIHPLQPYEGASGKRFYRRWFLAMTAAALVMALVIGFGGGERVTLYEGAPAGLPETLTFDVGVTDRPVRVQLHQPLSQTWAEYDLAVLAPDGTPLADTGRGISYYSGGSGEDAWSEGSRSASLTFAPTQAGAYTLRAAYAEGEPRATTVPLRLTVQEARGAAGWSWFVAVLFLLAFLATFAAGLIHRARRWSGSDWSEED